MTTHCLAWCCTKTATGKTALLLVWVNAFWHASAEVRGWISSHNPTVKTEEAAVRIVACPSPIKSPWLNPMEPKRTHGKRRIVEPARLLTTNELETRVDGAIGADHFTMPKQAT